MTQQVRLFQVGAFTTRLFGGNPAAVVLGEEFWPDSQLQQVAAENNLAETACLVRSDDRHRLRWFTPTLEGSAVRPRHPRNRRPSFSTGSSRTATR